MPDLPARLAHVPEAVRPIKARRREESAVSRVHGYSVARWADAQMAEADILATEEGVTAALESEMRTYVEYAGRAGSSAVLQELLARRMEQMSTFNSRSLNQHLR